MLNLDIDWLAPVSLVRSDRWLNVYMQPEKLSSPNEWHFLAVEALRDIAGLGTRKEDAEAAVLRCLPDGGDGFALRDVLLNVSDQVLADTAVVNTIAVRSVYAIAWTSLLSKVDPAWIIGAMLASQQPADLISEESLRELASLQCPNGFEASDLPFADNHVHVGGLGGSSLAMLDIAMNLGAVKSEQPWPRQPDFPIYSSHKRQLNELPVLVNNLFYFLASEVFGLDGVATVPEWIAPETWLPVKNSALQGQFVRLSDTNARRILKQAFDTEQPPQRRWLLVATAFLLHDRVGVSSGAAQLRSWRYALHAFIHACNILRTSMISAGAGLGAFVEHFQFSLRKGTNPSAYNRYALLHGSSLEVAHEYKVGHVSGKSMSGFAAILIEGACAHHSHFAFHFSRTSKRAESGDRLWSRARADVKKKALQLLENLLSADAYRHTLIGDVGAPEIILDLPKLLRGIDIAGNENDLPVELFAPAIRYLREHGPGTNNPRGNRYNLVSPQSDDLRPWHLCIHAGEDFNHIAGGLRAIDETLHFCNYRPGDRLGHALALGLNVQEWLGEQGKIYLSLQELVDNFVWCYEQARRLDSNELPLRGVLTVLEVKIARWSAILYGETKSPDILHQAWKLRRNCPVSARDPLAMLAPSLQAWVPDAELLSHDADSEHVALWRQYVDPNQLPQRGMMICITDASGKYPALDWSQSGKEVLSKPELELLTILQEAMMERLAQQDIAIEVCPSSNVYIGRVGGYAEHPVFRWHPPDPNTLQPGGLLNRYNLRTRPLRVCLNTDDPGLMPTSIAHEHRLLKDAARQLYPDLHEKVLDNWISALREAGLDIFNASHQSWMPE